MTLPSNKKSLVISLLAELSERMGDHKADLREIRVRHQVLAQRVNALETWRASQATLQPGATVRPSLIATLAYLLHALPKWMPALRLMAKGALWAVFRLFMAWGALSGTFLAWIGALWRWARLLASLA